MYAGAGRQDPGRPQSGQQAQRARSQDAPRPQSAPSQPAPSQPAPSQPAPSHPAPSQPAPQPGASDGQTQQPEKPNAAAPAAGPDSSSSAQTVSLLSICSPTQLTLPHALGPWSASMTCLSCKHMLVKASMPSLVSHVRVWFAFALHPRLLGMPASQLIRLQVQTSEATAVEVEPPKDAAAGQERGEAAGSREAADPASQPADSSASAPYLQPPEQVGPGS